MIGGDRAHSGRLEAGTLVPGSPSRHHVSRATCCSAEMGVPVTRADLSYSTVYS